MSARVFRSEAGDANRRLRLVWLALSGALLLAGAHGCTKADQAAITAATNDGLAGHYRLLYVNSGPLPVDVKNANGTMVHISQGTVDIVTIDNQFNYSLTFAAKSGSTLGPTQTVTRSGYYEKCNANWVAPDGKSCKDGSNFTYTYLFIGNDGGVDYVVPLSSGDLNFVEVDGQGKLVFSFVFSLN